ncbi:MAG: nickel pincer cofactor biosynthesis protein LarB [Planctomycetes bacterium]|nr:nickel pincer cofactor biosynthesis protein LarB [Planctomycetota bacterium]
MEQKIKKILQEVATGSLKVEEAIQQLQKESLTNLEFARIDHDRAVRCGTPEVVFGPGKTPEAICEIMQIILEKHGYALATRLSPEAAAMLQAEWPDCDYNEPARTVLLGTPPISHDDSQAVWVIAAGTSDLPVAEEACVSVSYAGYPVERLYDVGVAGIHRVLQHQDRLATAGAIIVVAGMEGALPSVVGGLVSAPIIAVPTSIGYGASFGGIAALLGMLNSCASGVTVVNIDNGFGAGAAASRILSRQQNFKKKE